MEAMKAIMCDKISIQSFYDIEAVTQIFRELTQVLYPIWQ